MAMALMAVAAVGQLYQGYMQGEQASAEADGMRQNARTARQQTNANEETKRRQMAQRLGNLRASAAGTGFDASTGSLLDLQGRQAGEMELDVLTNRYEGELKAIGFENQARSLKSQAKAARIGGVISAASTLAMGSMNYGGGSSLSYGQGINGGAPLPNSLRGGA